MVRGTQRIEESAAFDPVVARVRAVADRLVASPVRKQALQGRWLGHGLHPLMTDLPLGFWSSATLLDLAGRPASRSAAQRLVGFGVLAAVPTALTGLAEWAVTGQREQRSSIMAIACTW